MINDLPTFRNISYIYFYNFHTMSRLQINTLSSNLVRGIVWDENLSPDILNVDMGDFFWNNTVCCKCTIWNKVQLISVCCPPLHFCLVTNKFSEIGSEQHPFGWQCGGREDIMLGDNVTVSADKWLDTDSEWCQLPEPIKTINFHLITKTIRPSVTVCKLCVYQKCIFQHRYFCISSSCTRVIYNIPP